MNVGKIAEDLFVELCDFHQWNKQKILETNVRTPDYFVETPSGKFFAEVSFINYEMEFGKVYSIEVGEKVRKKITKKKGQLKDKNFPTMLVLCGSSGELSYENIVSAMYGDLTISINKITGESSKPFYGKNSYMSYDKNTSISAIAFLNRYHKKYFKDEQEEFSPCLSIYHNMYCKNPFSKDFFSNVEAIDEYWFELNKESA